MHEIIVIGAGVAGLNAAQRLKQAGKEVLILEKSRGLGGRSATRRLEGNRVDHGAQYFTVREKAFQTEVNKWLQQGDLKVWAEGFHRLTPKGLQEAKQGHPRYIFKDGMNTLGKRLGEGLKVRNEAQVSSIQKQADTWLLTLESTEVLEAKTVIVNAPAEQAADLLDFDAPALKQLLASVVMEPSFALMLAFPLSLAPSWQGILVEVPSSLSWISHDSSKRDAPPHRTLTLHSTAAFARAEFDTDRDEVADTMLKELVSIDNRFESPLFQVIHRWKYALASQHLSKTYIKHSDSLYFCGDWCGGARLESAFMSGLAVADALQTN